MRQFFNKQIPPLDRVLVIESGPREVVEKFLRHLYEVQQSHKVDLLTCFATPPAEFDRERGACYSIHDPAYAGKRGQLIRQLARGNEYSAVSMLCTGSPVMNKWKWAIAARSRAKTLIVNENADFFFLDWQHRHVAKMLASSRAGLDGGFRPGLLADIVLVPFTVAFLILSTGAIHLRRMLR